MTGVDSAAVMGLGLYYKGFPKVLNFRVLDPPSRLALIIGAWFVSQGI